MHYLKVLNYQYENYASVLVRIRDYSNWYDGEIETIQVVVHPLVLLSVVDHFNRVSKTQNVKRVVGVLLGSMKSDRTLDIANSFAGKPFFFFFFTFHILSLKHLYQSYFIFSSFRWGWTRQENMVPRYGLSGEYVWHVSQSKQFFLSVNEQSVRYATQLNIR